MTHLEGYSFSVDNDQSNDRDRSELTFWLFLLHQGPGKREWFYSWEFRTWYIGSSLFDTTQLSTTECDVGSIIAVLGMPLTTLITRKTLETVQLQLVACVLSD